MSAADTSIGLPTKEDLSVRELNLSSPILKAAAHHLGKYCDNQSKEFMLCMSEEKDPRKCLVEGKEVTSCGFDFFMKVRANCMKEFTEYYKCVDYAGRNLNLEKCTKQQQPFDNCVLDKLGWERPKRGYFASIRLHETDRPKPPPPKGTVPEWIPGPNKAMDEKPDPETAAKIGRPARGSESSVIKFM